MFAHLQQWNCVPLSLPKLEPCVGRAGEVAWPTACLRPSADCGSPIPSSAPSRCSPSCASSSQTWERATRRSARR
eukprot:scaffold41130_cov52-Phaeocystis_antarctica.AAC.1